MSSRDDHRRRERSWERDIRGDRDRRDKYSRSYRDEGRRRPSRSRSPTRGDRDRRPSGRRDYRRDDDRRDYRRDEDDRRDYRRDEDDRKGRDREGYKGGDRERDRGPERDGERDKKDGKRRDDRGRDRDDGRDSSHREDGRYSHHDSHSSRQLGSKAEGTSSSNPVASIPAPLSRPNLDPDAEEPGAEEGEAMDEVDDDSVAMMAMMGVAGFGSTKGKHVTGNQEGAVNIKKMRTWRQYMNRRGGFNRPLDKIK